MCPIALTPAVSLQEVHTWVDPSGIEHPLTQAAGFIVERGKSGVAMPGIEPLVRDAAFEDGALTMRVNVRTRRVQMPLYVGMGTPLALRDRLEQLGQWFDTRAGPGYWRVVNAAGDTRQLACRLARELDDDESPGQSGRGWRRIMIELEAADEPYWQDVEPTEETYVIGGVTSTWFGQPWFPLILGSSQIIDMPIVINDGTVEAWPVWTVTGPGSALSLRNLTTGRVLSLTYVIPTGGQVAIDTRPRVKSIDDGLGSSLFSLLSTDSEFWPMATGENRLQVELTNATAASSVVARYYRRWLRP